MLIFLTVFGDSSNLALRNPSMIGDVEFTKDLFYGKAIGTDTD